MPIPIFLQGENVVIQEYEIQLRLYVTALPSHDYEYDLFPKLSGIVEAALEGKTISDSKLICKNISKLTGDEIVTAGTPGDEQIAYIMRYRTVVQNV